MKRHVTTAATVALCAGLAHAQEFVWDAPVSGSWFDASNWNPAQVPSGAAARAILGLPGPYTVSVDSSGTSVGELLISEPAVTLEIMGARTLTIFEELVNNGLIIVNPTQSTSITSLQFGNSGTIRGSGEVRLNNLSSRAQLTTATGAVITHEAGHTISGQGQIPAELINNGTIDADVADTALRLFSRDKVNNALMAAGAGTLLIESTTVTQSPDGLILADGGEVELGSSLTVDGGSIVAEPGSRVVRSSGTSTLRNVEASGQIDLTGGTTTVVTGDGLINDGLITVNWNQSTSSTVLRFDESGTLSGAGEIHLNNITSRAQLTTAADAVITHEVGHTVSGHGWLTAELINNGTIDADVADTELRLFSRDKVNNALMTARAGTLLIDSITLTQGPDGLILADGGEVELGSSLTVDGGSIVAEPGSRVIRSGGTSTLRNVEASGQIDLTGGTTTVVTGDGLINDGLITVNWNQSTSSTVLRFDESGVLSGTGEIRLNNLTTRAQLATATDAVITNEAGHTISGQGWLTAELINNGTVDADVADTELRLFSRDKVNNALMAAGAGTLLIESTTVTQSPDGLILADGGEVELGSSLTVDGGSIVAEPGSRVVRSSGTSTLRNVEASGQIDLIGGTTTVVTGDGLINDGLITVNWNQSTSSTVLRFDESGVLSGTGEVRLNNLTSRAQLSSATGESYGVGEGQRVTGIGQIAGTGLHRGATAPGLDGIGALSFAGSQTLAPSHTLEIQLAGPSSSTDNYDRIIGSAPQIELDGTLYIQTINDYTPDFGQVYPIVTASSNAIAGEFGEIIAAEPLPGDLIYRLVYASNQVRLVVTCTADWNADLEVDINDFFAYLAAFEAGSAEADLNNDGEVDINDFFIYLQLFEAGC